MGSIQKYRLPRCVRKTQLAGDSRTQRRPGTPLTPHWRPTMKLLHIDSSILGQGSVSRTLSAEIVAAQRAAHPGIDVTYRDLAAHPIGHLTGAHLAALQGAVPAD